MTQSAQALREAVAGRPVTICLHAWKEEDGNQTYADPHDPSVDGWCVYVRSRDQEDSPFDVPFDVDREREDDARGVVAWLQGLFPDADLFEY